MGCRVSRRSPCSRRDNSVHDGRCRHGAGRNCGGGRPRAHRRCDAARNRAGRGREYKDELVPARPQASGRYRSRPRSRRWLDRAHARARRKRRGAAASMCWLTKLAKIGDRKLGRLDDVTGRRLVSSSLPRNRDAISNGSEDSDVLGAQSVGAGIFSRGRRCQGWTGSGAVAQHGAFGAWDGGEHHVGPDCHRAPIRSRSPRWGVLCGRCFLRPRHVGLLWSAVLEAPDRAGLDGPSSMPKARRQVREVGSRLVHRVRTA